MRRIEWKGFALDFSDHTNIMGVLNVTPDSFSDGGKFLEKERAIEQGIRMAEGGADIIDVGGESTRPFSEPVTAEEEMERVIPVIETLSKKVSVPISIDTYKSRVAMEALGSGASIINDVTALRGDPHMAELASREGVPVILMHMKGTPADMQKNPTYDDLMGEIMSFLMESAHKAIESGIRKDMIIIDPGIGFGKTFDHNLQILKNLSQLKDTGYPVLIGPSRKAFIGEITGKPPSERDVGTISAIVAGILNGADIVRVHNVEMAKDAVAVADAIKRGSIN